MHKEPNKAEEGSFRFLKAMIRTKPTFTELNSDRSSADDESKLCWTREQWAYRQVGDLSPCHRQFPTEVFNTVHSRTEAKAKVHTQLHHLCHQYTSQQVYVIHPDCDLCQTPSQLQHTHAFTSSISLYTAIVLYQHEQPTATTQY